MKFIPLYSIFYIIFFIELNIINSTLLFSYPTSVTLTNGNILVVEKIGIHICDQTMENIINTVINFSEEDQIDIDNKLANVEIKDKNNYIGVFVNFKLYLFTREGDLLKSTNRLISDDNPTYFSFVPIFVKSNNYYYVIAYFDSNVALKFVYFKISLSGAYQNSQILTNKYEKFKGFWGIKQYEYKNKGLSCEYMLDDYSHKYNYLVCYLMIDDDGDKITQDFYKISETKISDYHNYICTYIQINNVKLIKTLTIKDIKRALVFVFIEENNMYQLKIYKYYYEYRSTNLNLLNSDYKCINNFSGAKVNYIYEKNLLSFSCISSDAVVQSILFNNALNIVQKRNQFNECESIHGHSVLFSEHFKKFYIISDVSCYSNILPFFPLIGRVPNLNEENEEEEEINSEENDIFDDTENQEIEPQIKCPELEKCYKCNQESISKNLCIECNNENGYYFLKENVDINSKYIDCVNNITKPYNFYFDNEKQYYDACFDTCFQCNKKGDYIENNCESCDGITFIKQPEHEDSNNCVYKCKYYYYYTESGQYKCTNHPNCPDDYNTLIKEKNKCTNNCFKDDKYRYYYNRECYTKCPDNTQDDNDFICKDKNINRCILSQTEFFLFNENITDDIVEKMTKIYASEFIYTDTHVSIYKSDIYTITIYKDIQCISDLSLNTPEIIFGDCEMKVKNSYGFNENLIVAIIDKTVDGENTRKMISYNLYSPTTGKRLNSDDICSDDKLLIMENLEYKLLKSNIDLSTLSQIYSQGIDLFDLSSPFYTDVCFQYNSINISNVKDKDIALKDRVLLFFPNITLCEDGCDMKGINLTIIRAICECSYSNKDKDLLKDNALYQSQVGQLEEFISSTNIYVMKCYKNILNIKYFSEFIGGLIIFVLLIIEIICTIHYCLKGLMAIKIYVFKISDKYINYISPKKEHRRNIKNIPHFITKNEFKNSLSFENENNKIKENKIMKIEQEIQKEYQKEHQKEKYIMIYKPKIKNKKLILRKDLLYKNKNHINEASNIDLNNSNQHSGYKESKDDKDEIHSDEEKNKDIFQSNEIQIFSKKSLKDEKKIVNDDKILLEKSDKENFINGFGYNSLLNNNVNRKDKEFFNDYLQTEFENMEYDDILIKDKRHFFEYLKEKLLENQSIINTFCYDEPFKPRSIKIILFVLQIDLYLLINCLFYDENYVSEIFHLDKDTFYDKAGRFFGNLVYAALVGIIISYIIEWLFIDESRLKKIFKKKKDNIPILKKEVNQIIKDIKIRYALFFTLAFLITIFTLIHISCFNIVYPNLKWEWLIFSSIIIVFMQVFSAFICLLHTILRFISFKCKSEKLYKISYLLS